MWTETRLKFLSDDPIVNGLGEAGSYDEPAWPRYVRTTDIADPRSLRTDTFASLPPDVARRAILCRGDILMTAAGATIGKSYLHETDEPACYAGYLVRFRAQPNVDRRFVAYWTESVPYWDQIRAGRVVSTIENFSAGKYRNLRLRIPPFAAQQQIADFLDAEMARIDALIEKKRRMIALVEKRWATAVRLRLGELGSVVPLKRRWRVIDCKHRTPHYVDEGYPVVSPGDLTPGRLNLNRCGRFVNETDFADLTEGRRPQRGDIIYSRNASAGIAAYVDGDTPFCMGQDVCLITAAREDGRFLMYALNSVANDQLAPLKIGTTITRINVDRIAELRVPAPPVEVQRRLADEFDSLRGRVDALKNRLHRQIDLLAEHRQALITAAVTGELDVTKAAA